MCVSYGEFGPHINNNDILRFDQNNLMLTLQDTWVLGQHPLFPYQKIMHVDPDSV